MTTTTTPLSPVRSRHLSLRNSCLKHRQAGVLGKPVASVPETPGVCPENAPRLFVKCGATAGQTPQVLPEKSRKCFPDIPAFPRVC